MPCLSGRFDPIQGIFINIAVAKSGKITPATKDLKIPTFVALVDTGASKTCICSPNSWFNSDREVSNGVCYTYG